MKVIFFDFDGTINNWESFNTIDDKCASILKYIQSVTNARIVATTSMKYSFQRSKDMDIKDTSFYRFCLQLQQFGINIFDVTPFLQANKELEIKEYLRLHPEITEYVILDDEYLGDSLSPHQVYLDLYKGLQLEHIYPALNILNGDLGFYPKDYNTKETYEQFLIRVHQYYKRK